MLFVLSLVTALPSSAQRTPDPIEAVVQINVPMPVEKLNEQYTSTLYVKPKTENIGHLSQSRIITRNMLLQRIIFFRSEMESVMLI